MKILTFDIEEWYIAYMRGKADKATLDEYNRYLGFILDRLEEFNIKATFFCVGIMGKDYPEVIRRIHKQGHEIGCHSNIHTWLNKMSAADCRKDTKEAIDSLEQCIGEKIWSYRAPAFSIGESNKWVFDVLSECGIENDSSVYPAARDFGGFPTFGYQKPVAVQTENGIVKEFPIPLCKVLGKLMAFSGGGYFRLFPTWLLKNKICKEEYSMIYLHIADMLPETKHVMSRKDYEDYFKEKGTLYARYKRYLKANIGKQRTLEKLTEVVKLYNFVSVREASNAINWAGAISIQL